MSKTKMNADQLEVRELLFANRTYYVRTDGSDSNTGLVNTAGGAFLTIQKAIDTVMSIDIGIYDVTIQLADGTYTGSVTISGSWSGSGDVLIQGNVATPANVIITANVANGTIYCENGGRVILAGFEVKSSGTQHLIHASLGGFITFGNLRFGSGGNQQVRASIGGVVRCSTSYSIVAGGTIHCQAVVQGQILIQSVTVTLTGTPAFTTYALGGSAGVLILNGCTFSGTATGTRYSSDSNAVISSGGAGPNYLPGNAAGSTSNGGQYV